MHKALNKDHLSTKTLTTGWKIPSGTNSPPAADRKHVSGLLHFSLNVDAIIDIHKRSHELKTCRCEIHI